MKKTKKTIKNNICPHCKKDLKKVGIGFCQEGNMLYKIWLDKNNDDLQYETDEFEEESGGGEFYCQNCGLKLLLNHEDIIKILK